MQETFSWSRRKRFGAHSRHSRNDWLETRIEKSQWRGIQSKEARARKLVFSVAEISLQFKESRTITRVAVAFRLFRTFCVSFAYRGPPRFYPYFYYLPVENPLFPEFLRILSYILPCRQPTDIKRIRFNIKDGYALADINSNNI